MTRIALLSEAGKMGTRISRSLADEPEYEVLCVEGNAEGEQRLQARGDRAWAFAAAIRQADVVIMAVPDRIFGTVAAQAVPPMQPGAMLVCLDPAGPHAGLIPTRQDITIFVCHPANPSVFNEETDMAARFDFFGSGKARQPIVCALMQGPEEDYAKGSSWPRRCGSPSSAPPGHRRADGNPRARLVGNGRRHLHHGHSRSHGRSDRPRRPPEAARDFLLGHIFCELGILFDKAGFPFSDGVRRPSPRPRKTSFSRTGRRSLIRKPCAAASPRLRAKFPAKHRSRSSCHKPRRRLSLACADRVGC